MTALTGRRVLLVEDEPLIAMFAEMALEDAGAEVVGTAAAVAPALALLDSATPEVVLVDVRLRGGESGYTLAQTLAARRIPFVLATGMQGQDVPAELRGAPVLPKPYTAPQMVAALQGVLAG
ncbi:response regulator [Roseococcus sp. DSY-14]|uniref:response regulator n=1 Tax=Roseococcus sp. DSY-14 TaxID=3369650 RepID=UPI00387AB3C3